MEISGQLRAPDEYYDRVLRDLEVPVLIFHGTRDTIIPVSHGRKLRELARNATYIEYDCGHVDLTGREGADGGYWQEIGRFLVETGVIAGD